MLDLNPYESTATVAEAGPRPARVRRGMAVLLLFLSVMLAAAGAVLFSCMCGHLGPEALALTLPAAALAGWAWVATPNDRWFFRVLAMLVVIVVTMLVLKNVADVLWFGHSAVFGGS